MGSSNSVFLVGSGGTNEGKWNKGSLDTLKRLFPENYQWQQDSSVEKLIQEILVESNTEAEWLLEDQNYSRLDRAVHEISSLDPWLHKTPEEQLLALDSEVLQEESMNVDTIDEFANGVQKLFGDHEDQGELSLTIEDEKLIEYFKSTPLNIQRSILGLILSNLEMDEKSGLLLNCIFLRYLDVSGCSSLTFGPATFELLPRLVWINFSYNVSTDWNKVPSSVLVPISSSLLRLNMDGCELTTVPGCLSSLRSLQELTFTENEVVSLGDAILPLAKLDHLRVVDFRDNPVSSFGSRETYFAEFASMCPQLKTIDNRPLEGNERVGMDLSKIPGLMEEMTRTDTVMDHNEDRGSCSCIEGNPCQVEYTCKDWKNRFAIAKAVMEAK